LLEINYFIFSNRDNYKYIYPEINLVVLIDFNDQVNMQEKIHFTKNNDNDQSNNTYYPVFRKNEMENKKYQIGKFFHIYNNENFLIKINISLYTYTNHRILPIGSEEIYLNVSGIFSEMKKFHMYQNIHQRFINKKVGNLNFDISYKVDDFYNNQITHESYKHFNHLSVKFIKKLKF